MRILMIGHKYVPSRDGGIEIVVDELSTRMVRLGHEVTLFNRKRKDYPNISEYKGCKVKQIFTVNKKSLDAIVYSFFATLKARRLMRKKKVDIIHFHAEGPCFFLNLLPKTKRRKGCKVIVTIHGLDWQRGKWGGFASKILKSGEKKAVKYADEIIVLSENNKNYFKETYNRETIFIPNGVAEPNLVSSEIISEKYGISSNEYILFLARIVPEKGLDYLIDAWKQLSEENKKGKKLVIAGGASHSSEYFNEVMNKISDDETIVATGFIQGKVLEELYSNAYLYVLPSDIEGMPMSLLEALSYGNTCLVSDIPENTSIINDSSFSFKKSDVEDLKNKLIEILDKNILSHENKYIPYSWDYVVSKTLEKYKHSGNMSR